jgi:endonuclease/exonuclease/phosphatase family metal-dependent hydrolase
MATFLFWNIGQRNALADVVAVAHEIDVDVLILAESVIDEVALLKALNRDDDRTYRIPPLNLSPRLKFFVRYGHGSFESLLDEGGIALRLVHTPVGQELLLAAVHLPSKMYRSDDEQIIIATELGRIIRQKESERGHQNTIVIGDFNMDPFQHGMVAAHGLHAVSDKNIARRVSRTVDGAPFPFFYNPMWNYLGDENARPPGTYYYAGREICHFWHTFDQVLLRPRLLDIFTFSNLRIVTEVNGRSLMRNDRINTDIVDHLPVAVTLDLERLV